ncbi:MAG: cation:proton antiporter subunit C [Candidatus Hydrogenedentes bacterium]|nr:cation:proton antiporter subunit C [Candidatus Hydrogenedentota bacterium]
MTHSGLYAVTGVILFGLGLWGVSALVNPIRKVIGLNVMSVGVFLTLVAFGFREPPAQTDSVPQAMVLTGIVVSVSATALALALVRRQGIDLPHAPDACAHGERKRPEQ